MILVILLAFRCTIRSMILVTQSVSFMCKLFYEKAQSRIIINIYVYEH